jgi:hypothetical protein
MSTLADVSIQVTVESDQKQTITRVPPALPSTPIAPPAVAPKPSSKTITEYRTVRRIGQGGETISSVDTVNKRSIMTDRDVRSSVGSNDAATHESLMDSIRRFGGSQNLRKT